jgi:DNA-binding response OmpR family regulator
MKKQDSKRGMKKILYVEDNLDTAMAVQALLSNNGFEVELASCGKDALMKSENHYDIFLLDIILPDMTGWDVFNRLKEKRKNTSFAFISCLPISNEHLSELKKLGISDYILKPFTKEDLVERISKITRK